MIGALIGAAVIGGGAAIVASNKQSGAIEDASATQSRASMSAAQLQADTAERSLDLQKEQYNKQIELNKPFYDLGVSSISRLQSMSIPGGDPNLNYENDPLFKYQQRLGEKSINRAAAARGGFGSTATVNALGEFNRALSANEVSTQYNRLLNLVNIGRGGATSSENASRAYASGASGTMMNSANNISNITTAGANNVAALQIAGGQGKASMWSNIGALPMQAYNAYQSYKQPTMQPANETSGWVSPNLGSYYKSEYNIQQ